MTAWFARLRKPVFGHYLIVTNTLGYATLMGFGDVIIQNIERSSKKKLTQVGETNNIRLSTDNKLPDGKYLDWARVGRMCTIGLVMGPFNHFWYTFLDKVLPGTAKKTVIKKIFADQIVASPYFAFTFFIGAGTLEGQSLSSSFQEFKSKFWQVYLTDWMVWPAAQAVNFSLVPPAYQVLYVACITLGWNTFLSYMKHRDRLENLGRKPADQMPTPQQTF